MIAIPLEFEFTARDAAAGAKQARQEQGTPHGNILMGYLNQIRAAFELGETSLDTTCMLHELNWLARELNERGFQVSTSVHMMHGQLSISWESRA